MRRLAILTVFMLALLPLRWFRVLATPAGTIYLHELGLFVLAAVALLTVRGRVFVAAYERTFAFTSAILGGFAVWTVACLYGAVTLASTVKQVAYLVCFVVVVGLFRAFARSSDPAVMRTLRWSGAATTGAVLIALGLAVVRNGINPLSVLSSAIGSGNPGVVDAQLFRPAFAGFGYSSTDTVSQLRHEVFAGLLVGLLVASWARNRAPFRRTSARGLYAFSVFVAGVLLLLSLSRSIQLAAVAWPALAGLRLVVRGKLTRRAATALAAGVVVLAAAAASGLLQVVVERVTSDSSSYTERGAKLSAALDVIGQYPWLGGHYDDSISAHNFVLDAWLRGGIVMAVLMLVALLIVLARFIVGVLAIGRLPAAMVAATAAFVLPLVRMFTIGAGLMTPPEWVALAFAFAAAVSYESERAAARTEAARAVPPRGSVLRQPALVSGAAAVGP